MFSPGVQSQRLKESLKKARTSCLYHIVDYLYLCFLKYKASVQSRSQGPVLLIGREDE